MHSRGKGRQLLRARLTRPSTKGQRQRQSFPREGRGITGKFGDGNSLGALKFNSDTSLTFRREILAPFLAQYLKDGSPNAEIAPVVTFETGTNTWRRLQSWPAGCERGCTIKSTPLYLNDGLKTSFTAPHANDAESAAYVSDPAKPVPFRSRPIKPAGGPYWARWLVDDQREASGRPDVVTFVSNVLDAPVRLVGAMVTLIAATTT